MKYSGITLEMKILVQSNLCEVLAMSRAQLYRKFKALTNRSIIEYLQSYRLHIAHQMLINSNLNVTQVAFEVGFENLSHFSHRFHEEHGIRPSDVKKHSTEILKMRLSINYLRLPAKQ